MNDTKYIEMIKACGLYGNDHLGDMLELCYQVAKDEREACAKVCEDIDAEYEGEDVLATWCAEAIRARGEK
jgi:hypothetical protein